MGVKKEMNQFFAIALVSLLVACGHRPYDPADDAQIIQAVLDHPTLSGHFHPEMPGRVPLKLAMPDARTVQLSKFGKPVEIVEWAEDPRAAVVLVDTYTGENRKAHVGLTYPAEGVVGTFDLMLQGERWVITKAAVHEK